MCLFISVTPCDAEANVSGVKRVLKGASGLSVFPGQEGHRTRFFLQNNYHCACDLLETGGQVAGGVIELNTGGCEAVEQVANAMVRSGFAPFELRVCWAEQRDREIVELDVEEFREFVRAGSFDGGTVYVISGESWKSA